MGRYKKSTRAHIAQFSNLLLTCRLKKGTQLVRLVRIRVRDQNVAKVGLPPALNSKCLVLASGVSEPGHRGAVGYKEHGEVVTAVFEQEQR
jgi:hypothetical protein